MIFRTLLRALALLQLRSFVVTDAGKDWQARVMGDTGSNGSGAYAPANYMGVTANSDAPDASNTTLAGEIASGTLVRGQCVYAHTDGTSTFTLTRVLTSDQSVTIAKIGVFNAPSGGTMAFEELLNDAAIMVPGDQLQITHTFTL